MKNKHLIALTLAAPIVSVAMSFAHPFGNPRRIYTSSTQVLSGAEAPDSIREVLTTKCGDCHSEKGEWPIYSRVAPVSWLIERDVEEARSQLNLSEWDSYPYERQVDLLARLAAQARTNKMPPFRYTLVHPGSKLSPEEQRALYDWAKAERKRIKTRYPSN